MGSPECQMADCTAPSAEVRDHPSHGPVAMCGTCARLWSADAEGDAAGGD